MTVFVGSEYNEVEIKLVGFLVGRHILVSSHILLLQGVDHALPSCKGFLGFTTDGDNGPGAKDSIRNYKAESEAGSILHFPSSLPEAVIKTDGKRAQGLKSKVASLATNSSFNLFQ